MFFKRARLEGVIDELLSRLNERLEPLREESKNIDRLSMLLLIIGFVAVAILATVMGYLYNLYFSIGVVIVYLLILVISFYLNNRRLLFLQ